MKHSKVRTIHFHHKQVLRKPALDFAMTYEKSLVSASSVLIQRKSCECEYFQDCGLKSAHIETLNRLKQFRQGFTWLIKVQWFHMENKEFSSNVKTMVMLFYVLIRNVSK